MMNNQDIITEYLKNILPDQRDWETELITYAKENRIPIIEPVSMRFITQLIKLSQPAHILEIGTAIGYSALSMHHALPKAKITTLERDDEMISQAKENFAKYSINDHLNLITGDALNTLPELIAEEKEYDFIFIDAAKGQYKKFFEYAMILQVNKGVIVTDNVLFKGYATGKLNNHNRFQKLGKKINEYNIWLMNNEKYDTSILPIGDGIALSIKK